MSNPKRVLEALAALAEDGTLTRKASPGFTITVRGPLTKGLGGNSREHYYAKGRATKAARDEWWYATMSANRSTFESVRLTVHAYLCRKVWKPTDPLTSSEGYRPKDGDNLLSAMKPAFDGMVDAGLVVDDNIGYVSHGTPEITWVQSFFDERVEVLVEPL